MTKNFVKLTGILLILAITTSGLGLLVQSISQDALQNPNSFGSYYVLMKATNIEGSSNIAEYEGWSEIQAFQYGASFEARRGSLSSSGRIYTSLFTVIKDIDRSSPIYFAYLQNNTRLQTITIEVLAVADGFILLYKYILNNAYVHSMTQTVQVSDDFNQMLDTINFVYESLEIFTFEGDIVTTTILSGTSEA